jgi:K+-sensing histidine kinase KdpD
VVAYLLPAAIIAVYFGSTLAFLASLASGLLAAFFLFPPKFSLYIASPVHIAELGFFMLLALIASKAVAVVAHDIRKKKPIP